MQHLIRISNRSAALLAKAKRCVDGTNQTSSPSISPLYITENTGSYLHQQTPSLRSQQHRSVYSSATEGLRSPLRRRRKPYGKLKELEQTPLPLDFEDLKLPYEHKEATIDEYLKKTSLSPWVPMPDTAARKMMDLAAASSTDFHVDLGCGDGRVNFHAIDYGVSKSLGVDIDSKIVELARTRLLRRHPKPNVEFVVADLLKDTNHPVWEQIKQATLITMYFATEGLELFKPLLEMKLNGHQCKIITCGYDMPGWISKTNEVVNAMPLFLYEWGTYYTDEEIKASMLPFPSQDGFNPDDDKFEKEMFKGMNIVDNTKVWNRYLPDFNPNYKQDEEEWDYDWDDELKSVGYKMRGESNFGLSPSMRKKQEEEAMMAENGNNNDDCDSKSDKVNEPQTEIAIVEKTTGSSGQ